MGKRSRTRITKRLVEQLPPKTTIWDAEVRGFGVRRQVDRRTYIIKCSVRKKQHFITIGEHGSPWTAEAARVEARSILFALYRGEQPGRSAQSERPTSMRQVCERYLCEYAPRKKSSSIRSDRGLIINHIIPLIGDHSVSDIKKDDIERLHRAVRDGATAPKDPKEVQLRQRGGLPVRGGFGAANRCLTLLSKIFNLAEEWDLRPMYSNPARRVRRFPEARRERYLTNEQLMRIGEAFAATELTPFSEIAIKLLIFTGARLGEILTLRWEWVDLERGLLLLPDSKTGQKAIRLPKPAVNLLTGLPRYANNPHVFVGKKPGSRLINLQSSWRRLCKAANLDCIRLHDLRHTYASLAVGQGFSLALTGALLAHSSTKTTERYAHLQNDHVRQASEHLGLILDGFIGMKATRKNS